LKTPARRLGVAALLTAASGALTSLAFAPHEWDLLVWVSLVPFLLALARVGAGAAVLLGWLWCFVYSTQVADALPHAVETYFGQPAWLSWTLAAGIWTGTGCVYYMGFAPLYGVLSRRLPLRLVPALGASAWVAAEFARGRLWNELEAFVANPWALLGYALPSDGPVAQSAALGGIYAVGFAVVSVNAGLATTLAAALRGHLRLLPLGVGALPALFAAAFGASVLAGAPEPGGGVPIALVQADIGAEARWRRDHYGKNLALYLELTRRALAEARPRIVFWPEGSMTFFLEEEAGYRRAIATTLGAAGVELVAGGPARGDEPGEHYNGVFRIAPDGRIQGRYEKRYLVPFSEYFPFQGIDFLRRRFERVRTFRRGERLEPLETALGTAGVLVCNEALFPEVAGRRVAAGARYLLSPSNDSWIPSHEWADRMFGFAAYRAVEQRRPVVRVSTSGPSGVVDAFGRTLVRSEPFSQRVVLARLPEPPGGNSLYARVGDAFALSCGFAAAGGWLATVPFGRRRSQTRPQRSSARRTA